MSSFFCGIDLVFYTMLHAHTHTLTSPNSLATTLKRTSSTQKLIIGDKNKAGFWSAP
jgi:hypothetical protein